MGKKISLVKIRTYRYLHEADIARTALESQGIQAFIDSKYLSTINWIYTSMDGIGLRVDANDEKKALKILGPEETVKKTRSKKMKSSTKIYVLIVALLLLAWIFLGRISF
jgi:hypothetical protein